MKNFIRLMLSESGEPSSKRFAFFVVLFLFVFVVVYNMITGKSPSPSLSEQVFEAFLVLSGLVSVSGITNMMGNVKIKQAEANASVGAPSPTPDTTIVK
jgi:hypothetical protein